MKSNQKQGMVGLKILLIEDEAKIAEFVVKGLSAAGYDVTHVDDGERGLAAVREEMHDLVILDVMLPKLNGFDLLHQARSEGVVTPVIILSAKVDLPDRLMGFEMGADDYLPKPFNPNELLARIRAVLRRQVREVPGAPSQLMTVINFGSWSLDLSTRSLTRNGEVVTLTTGEFAVLKALVQHPREPLTRDKLMNLARGREWGAMERSIDVQVSRLRRLIEENPARARYIQTVWGVGYVFVPDGAE